MDDETSPHSAPRMIQFIYQAQDREGQALAGVVEAADLQTAFCELEARGWTVLTIRPNHAGDVAVDSEGKPSRLREELTENEPTAPPVAEVWQQVLRERSDAIVQGGAWCGELLEAFAGELGDPRTRHRWLAVAAACRAKDLSAAESALPPEQRAWLLLLSDVMRTRRVAPLLTAACSGNEPLLHGGCLRNGPSALLWIYPLVTLLTSWVLFIFFSCTIAVELDQWSKTFGVLENATTFPSRAYRFAMTLAALHREHLWAMIGMVGGLLLGVGAVTWWTTTREWWWRIPLLSVGRRLDAYASTARTLACLARADVATEQLLPAAAELVSSTWFRGARKTHGDRRFLNWLPQQIRAATDQAALTPQNRAALLESLAVGYAQQRQRRVLGMRHFLEPACIVASGMIAGLMMFILLTPLMLLTSNFVLW